ncbi:MAG: ATP-dependent DNA helicase RecG [Phycisphaerales bacterium]|nr:ATP-dependent DNA helicase RecG [Phycisphaerales bacterium]
MGDRPLGMSVQFLRGVGPARAAAFAALGIETVADLLAHLPFRYDHIPKSVPIGHLRADVVATIVGGIRSVRASRGQTRGSIKAVVHDGTGACHVRWFNSSYLRDKLQVGQTIRLTGKVEDGDGKACFVNPAYRLLEPEEDPFADDGDAFVPVYPATAQLSSAAIRRVVAGALEQALPQIEEILPESLRAARQLPPRRTAVARMHAPTSLEDAGVARRRLAYDELLLMQLAMQLRRGQMRVARGAPRITTTPIVDERIRARLPFALTEAQERAVRAIAADLNSDQPMTRLLQGDVGSGKTAVAVYAALTTIASRGQVAMLLPTEVLAQQTFERLTAYLAGSRVRMALLTGGMPRAARAEALTALARGQIDIVAGTHALLEPDVHFRRLALVIVDEQHRFGVSQRARLREKGVRTHYLVMTATPIPRTLAMTLYGDLDVTVIDALPPGRQPIATRLVGPGDPERSAAWDEVRRRLTAGEQAYIVYPLVEESEALDLKAATAEAENLRAGALAGFAVGLLHGRMSGPEKSAVIEEFRAGRLQALVSTTVIEVGVDVPAATVMVIEHAERYGLSQLHQLRGRVGRGDQPSCCLLMTELAGEPARQRLGVICATTDGFRIAEAD